jgi:hypothetical protein
MAIQKKEEESEDAKSNEDENKHVEIKIRMNEQPKQEVILPEKVKLQTEKYDRQQTPSEV